MWCYCWVGCPGLNKKKERIIDKRNWTLMGRVGEAEDGRVWWKTSWKIGEGVFQENEKFSKRLQATWWLQTQLHQENERGITGRRVD